MKNRIGCRRLLSFADALAGALVLLDLWFRVPTAIRLAVALLFLACTYFPVRRAALREGVSAARELFTVWFFVYLYMLLSLTLLDPGMGRVPAGGVRINLIPGASIVGVYLHGALHGTLPFFKIFLNLVGNLVVFAPLGVFLGYFFRPMRHWYLALGVVALSVAAVEGLQLLTGCGVLDIDDFLLNTAGAGIALAVCRIPPVRRLAERLTRF